MNTEHTQIPAEVREAIGRIVYHRPTTNALCAALAPLWPKPAPIPSDAEVAAAVERLEAECFPDEKHRCGTMAAAIRTVLAALAAAQQALRFASGLLEEHGTPGAEMFRKECRAAIDAARAKEARR